MQSLREALSDWQDVDGAMYHLAVALGVLTDSRPWGGRKDLFWTNNPVGNALFEQLRQLAELGVLEFDEDETRFRRNPAFVLP